MENTNETYILKLKKKIISALGGREKKNPKQNIKGYYTTKISSP